MPVYFYPNFQKHPLLTFTRDPQQSVLYCCLLSGLHTQQALLPQDSSRHQVLPGWCVSFLFLFPASATTRIYYCSLGLMPLTAIICTCKSENWGQSFNDRLFFGSSDSSRRQPAPTGPPPWAQCSEAWSAKGAADSMVQVHRLLCDSHGDSGCSCYVLHRWDSILDSP